MENMHTCDKTKDYIYCPECGRKIKDIKYTILEGVGSVQYIIFDKEVERVWVLLDREHFDKTEVPIHRKNAFLQDPGHDWHNTKDGIKISLSGGGYIADIIIEHK